MSLDVYLTNDACPHCGRGEEVYWANITHNLSKMADALGIYEAVWRPDENGITHARQIIERLGTAIYEMRANPDKYRQFDAPNGWGKYEHFLPWIERYQAACVQNPDATIRVSR